MKNYKISARLTKAAKLNLSISEAYKHLSPSLLVEGDESEGTDSVTFGEVVGFETFTQIWDASKSREGVANFAKIGTILDGFVLGFITAFSIQSVKVTDENAPVVKTRKTRKAA
jgi:hypothetical protein